MKIEVFISPQAEIDLENIWLYTFKKFNEIQADLYFDELVNGIDNLVHHPEMGISRSDIRKNYRSIQINHHVIFNRYDNSVIEVIRLLHERMLAERHLSGF